MRIRGARVALCCVLAVAASGCAAAADGGHAQGRELTGPGAHGGGISTVPSQSGAPFDGSMPVTRQSIDRDSATRCLSDHGITSQPVDSNTLQIVGPGAQPRIVFGTTPGEADARSFAAKAEGAEQIANALVYVNQGSDGLLRQVETCLASS